MKPDPHLCGCAGRSEGEDLPRDWDPNTAMTDLIAARVDAWRSERGLAADEDFAFRWTDEAQAIADAGHHVAHAWLRVRAAQEDGLLSAAASVIESGRPTPSRAPMLEVVAKKKPKGPLKRAGIRLRANTSESPEAITNRVDSLAAVLQHLGAIRPHGVMSEELQSEWSQACVRLSQHLVTQSEAVTVLNAIRTAHELSAFLRRRSRQGQPERVDLDSFLHSAHATSAPSRALASFKWLSRNGSLDWDMAGLTAPAPRGKRAKAKGQAIVVAPPMLPFLEERVEELFNSNDERWTALLGSWIVAVGCLRYQHVLRTQPRRVSLSTVHCWCTKGKQRSRRSGFHFAVPGTFSSGFPWGSHWLELWQSLGDAAAQSGLCFDRQGRPWALQEITQLAQEHFSLEVSNPADLTTYSWRRWAPTFGHALEFTPTEMSSLSDWQTKGDTPRDATMPLHYSSNRYTQSVKMKHLLVLAMYHVAEFEAWEVVPPSSLRKAAMEARGHLDGVMARDAHTLWSRPLSPTEARTSFQLADGLKQRAALLRDRGQRAVAARSMPAVVNGRVVSSFMKNGESLCGSYQIGRCTQPESSCDGKHLCAILFKAARVCGGRHPACDCHDRRAILATETPPPPANEVRRERRRERPPLPVAAPAIPIAAPAPVTPVAKPAASSSSLGETQRPRKRQRTSPQHHGQGHEGHSDQADEARFDRLATVGGRSAESPTCVFKHDSGGCIYLGGLPTEQTVSYFPKVQLQVTCFVEPLEQRNGVVIPGALPLVIAPTDKRNRDLQWRSGWPTIRQSVQSGEAILLHCMAGRHRAAGMSVLCRALFTGERLEDSAAFIASRRDIEMHKFMQTAHVADWVHHVYRTSSVGAPLPAITGFIATTRSRLHLCTEGNRPLCTHKQASGKSERLTNPLVTSRLAEAVSWNRDVCEGCRVRAPAGWQMQLSSV